MTLIDPFELIKTMPPGSASYGRAGESREKMETCFLIREDEEQIKKIPKNPVIQLRSGFWEEPVCLVTVMVMIGGLPYETWWNYHQPYGSGRTAFEDMIRQTMIPILVYDHREMKRSVMIRNSLAPAFRGYAEKILARPPWGMKNFDEAREEIYRKYPSVMKLWSALAG